jgi:uncharacterized phage protein (TIGR01671 family)
MRELKFRYYDPYNNRIEDVKELYVNEEGKLGVTRDDGAGLDNCDTIMQYTGLKDKNNVEIYEGDIVKRTGCINTFDMIYEVRWCKGDVCFRYYDVNEEQHYPVYTEVEIIGNIHQNPELLGES